MALINPTCLKAWISAIAFFVKMVKTELGKGKQLCCEKIKADLFYFPSWKDSKKSMRNCDTSHKGTALGEQNPPALPEQAWFGEGDVICTSLSPLARRLQWHPVALMRVISATFIQFRMCHLIFRCLFQTISAILDSNMTLADITQGPWKSCVLLERQLKEMSYVTGAKLH